MGCRTQRGNHMTDSILVDTFGDSVNLRILSFFAENPFDQYSITEISEFADVSRNSVYKYIEVFIDKDYLTLQREGSRNFYKLNRSNHILKLIDRFIDDMGTELLKPEIEKMKVRKQTGIPSKSYFNIMIRNQMCGGVA